MLQVAADVALVEHGGHFDAEEKSRMPECGPRYVLDGFIAELLDMYRKAGKPSFDGLERVSVKLKPPSDFPGLQLITLSATTTNDILRGKRQNLPKWQWVASFVIVLREVATQNGVDLGQLSSLNHWKIRHERAQAASQPAQSAPGSISEAMGSRPAEAASKAGPVLTSADLKVAQRATLLTDAHATRTKGWWLKEFGTVVPEWFEGYVSLERMASMIRIHEPYFVPGLLQTRDYAQAVIESDKKVISPAEVALRVQLRLSRQEILSRRPPPDLWVIMDEITLNPSSIAPVVMKGQLRHLIRMSHQPNITIQVIPACRDSDAIASGPVSMLRFPSDNQPDIVYLERLNTALYPQNLDELNQYSKMMDRLAVEAERPAESRMILSQLLGEPDPGLPPVDDLSPLRHRPLTVHHLATGVPLVSAVQASRRISTTAVNVLDYTEATAAHHGRLLAHLRRSGNARAAHDLIIAAHAAETKLASASARCVDSAIGDSPRRARPARAAGPAARTTSPHDTPPAPAQTSSLCVPRSASRFAQPPGRFDHGRPVARDPLRVAEV